MSCQTLIIRPHVGMLHFPTTYTFCGTRGQDLMHYLIDGHNLIGQLAPYIRLDDPHDEAKLVLKLNGFCAASNHRCVVVFDNGVTGGRSVELSRGRVEVIFAARGRTNADAIIIERLRVIEDVKAWTVVTNDREVKTVAMERKIAAVPCLDFARQLMPIKAQIADAERRKRPVDPGEAPDPQISRSEVAEYLKLFGGLSDKS